MNISTALTQLTQTHQGIDWDTSTLVHTERFVRARLYRKLFHSLLETCRLTQPSLTPAKLTYQYLQERGAKAFRQAHQGYTQRTGQRPNTTRALLNATVLLHQYSPAALDCLEAGKISILQVETLLKHVRALPEPARPTMASDILELAEQNHPEPDFLSQAQQLREKHQPEPLGLRAAKAAARRYVSITEQPDSMCQIRAYLPAKIGHKLMNQLNALTRTARYGEPTDGRSPAQIKADIFVDLLNNQQLGPAQPTYGTQTVLVLTLEEVIGLGAVVPEQFWPALEKLSPQLRKQAERNRDHPDKPWLTDSDISITPHGSSLPISATEASELINATTQWWKIVTEPITGYPLGLGRKQYRPSQEIRTLIGLRDQRCRVPGCQIRAQDCDLDHLIAWILGGRTDYNNLIFLCRNHHQHKTNGWLSFKPLPEEGDGVFEITNVADGHTVISRPPWPLAPLAWQAHR